MEKEHYTQALSRHHELPIGFSNYLAIALEEFQFEEDRTMGSQQLTPLYLSYIHKGLAMLYAENLKSQALMVVDFYGEGDFLPAIPISDGETHQLKILFLEKTTLLALNERHYTFLPKIFISTSLLYQKIGALTIAHQLKKELIGRIKPGNKRLAALQQWRPQFKGRIPENYLKNYLNMRIDK